MSIFDEIQKTRKQQIKKETDIEARRKEAQFEENLGLFTVMYDVERRLLDYSKTDINKSKVVCSYEYFDAPMGLSGEFRISIHTDSEEYATVSVNALCQRLEEERLKVRFWRGRIIIKATNIPTLSLYKSR